MASRMVLLAYVLMSLLDVGHAQFETLSKPFTGTKQEAWESMASILHSQNERRRSSDASASGKYKSAFSSRQSRHNRSVLVNIA